MKRCAHPDTKVVRDKATPHLETVHCKGCGISRVRTRESWLQKQLPKSKRRAKR